MSSALILDVERFLRRTGMAPTRFGREAMGDPRFVFQLRQGRELRASTGDKVRRFLDARA